MLWSVVLRSIKERVEGFYSNLHDVAGMGATGPFAEGMKQFYD
jgi:hypothetical protein